MPKLGAVPPVPEPIDPFKVQGPAPLGVVPGTQVSAVPEKAPKLGVVRERGGQVVSVAPQTPESIGVVAPALSPSAPSPSAAPIQVGVAQDETPAYPPLPAPPKPALGTVTDKSITPAQLVDEPSEPAAPVASQPIILDPLAPKE